METLLEKYFDNYIRNFSYHLFIGISVVETFFKFSKKKFKMIKFQNVYARLIVFPILDIILTNFRFWLHN